MGSYLQTGDKSWNLANNPQIGNFSGIVLSPVNDPPDVIAQQIEKLLEKRPDLDVIFDPQLYNPASSKGKLPLWAYFGNNDFETQSDVTWWTKIMPAVIGEATRVHATTVCSPAPFSYSKPLNSDYYKFVVDLADEMETKASDQGLETAVTVIVPLAQLHDETKAMEIASTISGSRCNRVFLNFLTVDGTASREPLRDSSVLGTAVHLVRLLSQQQRVHVACTSLDVLLWLGAGAADVSTGKHMNLRRFTPSRWFDETASRRTQVEYWCDDKLLALLRDRDVVLLDKRLDWFKDYSASDNPAGAAILKHLRENNPKPWLGLSWVQYMRWFVNTTRTITTPQAALDKLLSANTAWKALKEKDVLLYDQKNGDHIVDWFNALKDGLGR